MTTSQRLSRSIERTRVINDMFEKLSKQDSNGSYNDKFEFLYYQLLQASKRSKLLQQAMTSLYLAISVFLATSFLIGFVLVTDLNISSIPLISGFIGALLLFYASAVLILESRIAIKAVYSEMAHTLQVNSHLLNRVKENHLKKDQ